MIDPSVELAPAAPSPELLTPRFPPSRLRRPWRQPIRVKAIAPGLIQTEFSECFWKAARRQEFAGRP